jgi:hypothetical protein
VVDIPFLARRDEGGCEGEWMLRRMVEYNNYKTFRLWSLGKRIPFLHHRTIRLVTWERQMAAPSNDGHGAYAAVTLGVG